MFSIGGEEIAWASIQGIMLRTEIAMHYFLSHALVGIYS